MKNNKSVAKNNPFRDTFNASKGGELSVYIDNDNIKNFLIHTISNSSVSISEYYMGRTIDKINEHNVKYLINELFIDLLESKVVSFYKTEKLPPYNEASVLEDINNFYKIFLPKYNYNDLEIEVITKKYKNNEGYYCRMNRNNFGSKIVSGWSSYLNRDQVNMIMNKRNISDDEIDVIGNVYSGLFKSVGM